MTTIAHMRKGWCPGALRPMRSGDGLLVRVRPHAGGFSVAALQVVGSLAARFGSGEIDLTSRGNLQLRGLSDGTFHEALAELDDAGLLDATAEAEAVRNVLVDPLSGLDPDRVDVRDIAAWLEDMLASDSRLWSLPGKFGFSVSGSAAPLVGSRATDVMLAAHGSQVSIFIDGAAEVCCEVPREKAIEAAHHLGLAFVELKENDAGFRRMRDAVGRLGAVTVFAMAGLRAAKSARGCEASAGPIAIGRLGRNDQTFGVGIGLPFGRISASQLDALCVAASGAGLQRVHSGPDRILVFSASEAAHGDTLLHVARSAGLITEAGDVRLAMDVCPGAPACPCAGTETRRDAERLAGVFDGGMNGHSLHISGCEKGCARQSAASITLVGRRGFYDIVRNGCAHEANAIACVRPEDVSAAISRFIMEPAR